MGIKCGDFLQELRAIKLWCPLKYSSTVYVRLVKILPYCIAVKFGKELNLAICQS